MFFGGFSGATAFFFDRVADDTSLPPIVLTDFKLFGNSVALGKNSPLTRSIDHTNKLRSRIRKTSLPSSSLR